VFEPIDVLEDSSLRQFYPSNGQSVTPVQESRMAGALPASSERSLAIFAWAPQTCSTRNYAAA
ncbi:hypothetical protein, partial [Mesorhizobium sp.]|uniref:hypothetical protein n=1 Tax=Mesorhizobium sp. TaxID=1871066 RepID=UPI0025F1650E